MPTELLVIDVLAKLSSVNRLHLKREKKLMKINGTVESRFKKARFKKES